MNMRKLIWASLLVGAMIQLLLRLFPRRAPAKLASDSSVYDAIDAYIKRQMRRLRMPGVSLAIVEGDKIVHLRGFGKAHPHGRAPGPQTPFFIGSLTKSITAVAVMQLVEAGKIELDAPVRRYLPWFRLADPDVSARMTVRHLLNQTSGLPMLPGMAVLADFDDSPGAARRQVRALSTIKLTRLPGAAFEYSNLNYNVLGLVIESVSGEAYADYIQKHIFTPLDMSHSYTSHATAKQNGLAVGHRYWFSFPVPVTNLAVPRGSLSSGQLISSTNDLSHYLIAYLNGGRYGSAQLLSPASIAQMQRGVAEVNVMGASVGKYGMGWFNAKIGETTVISHGGNVPDFSGYIALLPEQQKGIVLLVNADHYGLPFVLEEVGAGAAALLAGEQPTPIKLGLIPWVMRALLLVPLSQIAGVAATLRLLHRWRRDPARVSNRERMWLLHILLPLIPNLFLAAVPIFLRVRGLLGYLKLYMPDVYWTAFLCGSFAPVWSFLRTGLVVGALSRSSSPQSFVKRSAGGLVKEARL